MLTHHHHPSQICAGEQEGYKNAMWVLGTKPHYSTRAVSTLNHWAISPAPHRFPLTFTFYFLQK